MNMPDERDEWSDEEQRLHHALHHAAEQIQPGPDGLARIRRRTGERAAWWRSPVVIGLAGATALAAALIVGGLIMMGDDDGVPIAATTTEPSDEPPSDEPPSGEQSRTDAGDATPTGADETTPPGPAEQLTVPVYYVVSTDDGLRLAREFHSVETTESPVTTAVAQLTAPALDPDYATLWPADLDIASTRVVDGTIEVDLGDAPSLDVAVASDDAEAMRLAAQQLVYTATAAAAMHDAGEASAVQVTIAGERANDLFGGAAEPTGTIGREDPLEIRQLVQIDDPAEGATVTSPVTVSGSAAAFEATVQWELTRDGEVVDDGTVTAEECCTMSPFEFQLDLDPGAYEVAVSEIDVSGGEGRAPMSDTKAFTVE